jgi:hypothetical protein
MLILEGDSSLRGKIDYLISFPYKGSEVKFESMSLKDISGDIFDWLYNNGYKFDGKSNNSKNRRLLNEVELENLIKTTTYGRRSFHNVAGKNLYLINSYNSHLLIAFIIEMLVDFGVEKNQITTNGFDVFKSKIKKFDDIDKLSTPDEDLEEIPNVYCVRAGVANKDANIFLEGGFVGINYDTQGFDLSVKTKQEIIELLSSRDSSKRAIQQYIQQIELFKEIQDGDIILVPDSDGTNIGEVSSDMYLADGEYPNRINVEWLGKIEKNSSLNIPKTVFKVNNFNTDDLKFTNSESDDVDDIETFSTRFGIPTDFKAVQAQEEKEAKEYVKNPFRQSICVLGESGAGKSTTLENILEAEKHEFEFIIPSASTTGLLSQFSPSKSGYIKSRLGRMLVDAFNNPKKLYTAVFDECHKSNTIEMINDELLQAISIKRNNERRFISLDEDTSELYKGVETHRGNIIIPDNFGFIFISSKPRIIANNTDFFNRVDLVVLKSYEEEKIQTSKELLSKVLPYEEKIKLASTRND